jgi:hypothetical protein
MSEALDRRTRECRISDATIQSRALLKRTGPEGARTEQEACHDHEEREPMSIAERIYQQVKGLPDSAAKEILDFTELIGSRLARQQGEAAGGWQARTEAEGDAEGWPEVVLTFEGLPDAEPFERDRAELLPPAEDPLA